MEVRVLGTSTYRYLKIFQKIPVSTTVLQQSDNKVKYYLVDRSTGNIVYSWDKEVTRRQYIEIWTIFGWVKKTTINGLEIISERGFEELLDKVKDSLLKSYSRKATDAFVNMKLLAIEAQTRVISDDEFIAWKIRQIKGSFDKKKLGKEISVVEKRILQDIVYLAKLREALYAKIVKEL